MSVFNDYIQELQSVPLEQITEHSHRSTLESLLKTVSIEMIKQGKLVFPPNILHEPKRKENYGAPDFLIYSGHSIIGYVENKKIGENLDKILKTEQIKKYRELSDNIILTNYLEFIWIKGEYIQKETLCSLSDLENKKFILDIDKEQKVWQLISNFLSQIQKKIANTKEFAYNLANCSRNLKEFLYDVLIFQESNNKRGKLFGLYETFRRNIFNELKLVEFADAFAQMLVYGLFFAKLNADTKIINLKNVDEFIPKSFQLIRELVGFLKELNEPDYFETKWIIDEAISIMNNLDLYEIKRQMSFKNKVFDDENLPTDPYLYFYETFLAAYDKNLRKTKGVYYTPQPIVNFIIRAIDEVLKDTFRITTGLADNSKVTVLDFATGTGTFIVEIFKQVFEGLSADSRAKRDLIISEHLLKNIYGFEYLIAPYTIAHLKLSQFLAENEYDLKDNERLQIYLTNTLEPVHGQPNFFVPHLSEEGAQAQNIKEKPILVITGNPPYYGNSKNRGNWISDKIKDYYFVDGKSINEKNPKWLQDDYVKFIRFAQDKIDKVEEGIVGIITNHSFLDNPTFRGMRQSLTNTFNQMYFIDLHGNKRKKEKTPEGNKDENIFDIEQGVSISILIKKTNIEKGIFHFDLWGLRKNKFLLLNKLKLDTIKWAKCKSDQPFYFFRKQEDKQKKKYNKFWSVNEIFNIKGVGITTAHDNFVIDKNYDTLLKRFTDFRNSPGETRLLHEKFNVRYKLGWDILKGWENLQKEDNLKKFITVINYRIFDKRFIFYEDKLVWRRVKNIMLNFQENNIALITSRTVLKEFKHIFISEFITNFNFLDVAGRFGSGYVFPLYILKNGEEKQFFGVKEPIPEYNINRTNNGLIKSENFNKEFRQFIDEKFKKHYSPEEILGYIYAVLHSPTYRTKYSEFLKIDFPRVPFVDDSDLFQQLSDIGTKLINAHLLKKEITDELYINNKNLGSYKGIGRNNVEKINFTNNRLYINKSNYFNDISQEVYNFSIGGYQILNKYLKDRKDLDLDLEEIQKIENIIRIISITIDEMKEIDFLTKEWI
jgi:predicted helicase